ncbi:MAG TPA: hypothetical protein PLN21_05315 [Gemmatales bacterium]|nr:hypothetical protein [Gemmatales bacterium]
MMRPPDTSGAEVLPRQGAWTDVPGQSAKLAGLPCDAQPIEQYSLTFPLYLPYHFGQREAPETVRFYRIGRS